MEWSAIQLAPTAPLPTLEEASACFSITWRATRTFVPVLLLLLWLLLLLLDRSLATARQGQETCWAASRRTSHSAGSTQLHGTAARRPPGAVLDSLADAPGEQGLP